MNKYKDELSVGDIITTVHDDKIRQIMLVLQQTEFSCRYIVFQRIHKKNYIRMYHCDLRENKLNKTLNEQYKTFYHDNKILEV